MHHHTKFEIPSSNIIRDMIRTRYSNNLVRVQGQGHSDPNMVCDTPPSQDAFTHQIWKSYLIEYRRYAPESMHFLKTRSEVKFNVTVTQLWYVTLLHPKMHQHTKFEIPTSNNMRYAPDTIILKTRSEVKVKVAVTQKLYATLRHPKMHPHTKFGIPTSKNIGDMHLA